MSTNLAVVAQIYEAFGRGDVPSILEYLTDDVVWEGWADNSAQRAGVPWLVARYGKASVPGFFEIVGSFQIREFSVLSIFGSGNQVAAEILIDTTVPGGGHFRDEELHLWTFDESGRIVRFRHYVDTAKHIAAAGL
jgi:ketosteroid isomerase-like protein